MCIDMDAFFASVEQQANPQLRGKPVAVIGSGARTVITTRSYEARAYGVKTGMNIYEAMQLCPNLVLVVGDNKKYIYTCGELEKIYRQFTPDVEVYSIDEAFLDITTTQHLFGGPEAIGKTIKESVKTQFGINCTVGIAPNILIAKLASDLAKPDGLRWVKDEDIAAMLEDLPVKELWGIGPGISERLETLGIKTCGELGRAPASLLRNKFGIVGESLKAMGMGICDRPLAVETKDPKSIGHSTTLPKNTGDRKEIESSLLRLSEMVCKRARKYGYMGRKVTLTIRYPNFETFTKQTTLPDYTNYTRDIYNAVLSILDGLRLRDSVRLLGVCISDIVNESVQVPLFDDRGKQRSLLKAMDDINDRYGDSKLMWASCMKKSGVPGVISPSWSTSGVKNLF